MSSYLMPEVLHYYDTEIVRMVCEKYGFTPHDALRKLLHSETYSMLIDPELEMTEFSPLGIFDMWENEMVTGDSRTSLYIPRDERV